jgi:splicing factor 1
VTAFGNHPADLFAGADHDGPRRRKKRNRWGEATENKAAGLMGLPTAIVADMTSEQLEAYTLHLRIEEITQKLKIDDVVPADGDRYVAPCLLLACVPISDTSS